MKIIRKGRVYKKKSLIGELELRLVIGAGTIRATAFANEKGIASQAFNNTAN
ncbi:hypothetical protein [Paraclostridium dentum]|uniref:hypothetical protein n=1 Tax=Paraclostridium dentum TaxID=2662455 RepID=UPI003B008D54